MPAAKLQSTTTLIERLIALGAFAALLLGVALVLRPFVTGILFGTILVIATWPLRELLVRHGLSAGVAATVLLLFALGTIGVPAVILAPGLGERLVDGIQRVQAYFAGYPELPNWVAQVPWAKESISGFWSSLADPGSAFQAAIKPYSAEIRKALIEVARAFAEGVFQFFVSLAVATMLWLRGDALSGTLREITERLGGSAADAALLVAADSVRGVAYGTVGTAAIQAIAMTVGLIIAGVPGAGLLGFLSLIIALSQFGILLVIIWGGAAWWLFGIGDTGWGIFVAAWGLLVSTVDNFIRPWLVSFGAEMPLIVIFLGVLGGFIAFGFLGLFIGPTLLGVFYKLLQAWRELPESSTS
ncbi:MAG: AI-2E family transporter [Candidatus Binatia bacterium]|jgi:predicted PurR-regulated permease PerM